MDIPSGCSDRDTDLEDRIVNLLSYLEEAVDDLFLQTFFRTFGAKAIHPEAIQCALSRLIEQGLVQSVPDEESPLHTAYRLSPLMLGLRGAIPHPSTP